MKIRGFEIAKGFENVTLPLRSTQRSAGYDFFCAEEVVIPSVFRQAFNSIMNKEEKILKPTFVKTGVKAYMPEDEALFLYNRSSNPGKKGLVMANSVGVVDSDYYGNPDNDGHIMFAFYNFYPFDITLKAGEKIGQGIFQKYLTADNDSASGERTGGFGSTGS